MAEPTRPAPPSVTIPPSVLPFYEAAADGRLVLAYCPACDRHELPGTRTCPACLSRELTWRPAGGGGRVYSFVVFRRSLHPAFEVPYAVCVIELDEGPRMVAGLIDVEPDAIAVGTPVEAVFAASEDGTVPVRFRRGRGSRRSSTQTKESP
jgi:uncharacterized OB-fold protein